MKKEVILTILLVILVIILILGMKFTITNLEEGDAKTFVLEDLKVKFPNADKIEIISSENKTNENGIRYYTIMASVSENLHSRCPTKTYYYYNYPTQNFVPAPPEYVVKNCEVCKSTPCLIAFVEEAIIASYTIKGTEDVYKYVIATNAVPETIQTQEGWRVLWISSTNNSNYSYEVFVNKNGYISQIKKNDLK
ncbi:MAG: hypothetical protein AB1391_02285 [Candidatus Micrarchaeota archaeon]